MEALSLLRQCTMARKTVREEKDYYVFGHRRIPKDTPTAWKSQVQSEVSEASALRGPCSWAFCSLLPCRARSVVVRRRVFWQKVSNTPAGGGAIGRCFQLTYVCMHVGSIVGRKTSSFG